MIPDENHIRRIQDTVERMILDADGPLTEYALIREVERVRLFDGLTEGNPDLALFRKHFLVMHVLYRLQMLYLERGRYLHVSALAIQLLELRQGENGTPAKIDDALTRYYLDLDEWSEVGEAEVVKLLNRFWQRYGSWVCADDAYRVLGVDVSADWPEVQAAFRRAAATSHPDKGGKPEQFQSIFDAYQSLKLRLKPR